MHKRLRFLSAAVSAAALLGASAAAQASPLWLYSRNHAGKAQVETEHDTVRICDRRADGHSVVFYYGPNGNDFHITNYHGAGSCQSYAVTRPNRLSRGDTIEYFVCLADNGTPGGRKLHILLKTCGVPAVVTL